MECTSSSIKAEFRSDTPKKRLKIKCECVEEDKMCGDVQVVKSSKGTHLYSVNGYLYEKDQTKVYENGITTTYAKCSKTRSYGCQARIVITEENNQLCVKRKASCDHNHNHPRMTEEIVRKQIIDLIKKCMAENLARPIKECYNDVIQKFLEDDEDGIEADLKRNYVPTFDSLGSILYREKAKFKSDLDEKQSKVKCECREEDKIGDIQVIKSCRGTFMYSVNGYLYEKGKTKVSENEKVTFYASCSKMRRHGCQGRIVITVENLQLSLKKSCCDHDHNHPPMTKEIIGMQLKDLMKKAVAEDRNRPLKDCYNDVVHNFLDNAEDQETLDLQRSCIPSFNSMESTLRRERSKFRSDLTTDLPDSEGQCSGGAEMDKS